MAEMDKPETVADDTLSADEFTVVTVLLKHAASVDVETIIAETRIDQSRVAAATTTLVTRGLATVSERERFEIVADKGARQLLASGLPERRVALWLAGDAAITMDQLVARAKEHDIGIHEAIKWGERRGWIERLTRPKADNPKQMEVMGLQLTPIGREALASGPSADETLVSRALQQRVFLDEIEAEARTAIEPLLKNRKGYAELRKRTQRFAALTDTGRRRAASARQRSDQTALTSEALRDGTWRSLTLRPYDVTLPAATVVPAKTHPLRRVIERTRRAFLEMGFTEVASPMIEKAFWNFDALFQPQDHPARDMQDTFYMSDPAALPLPDAGMVDRVRRTHEDGGDTGSHGWGYRWEPAEARRVVLRTHTTAATIRALTQNPEAPRKVFCVGWTYRNESISFKHLPVFHQVDGVVVDSQASLSTLMGTLREFYWKMGFDQVRFKPAFYPYTEPSMDVVVYMPARGKWIEMGGSGVFRPEVTRPLGCTHPVLAWGLGIERLAMLTYGFENIRDLYHSSLDVLGETPLCR